MLYLNFQIEKKKKNSLLTMLTLEYGAKDIRYTCHYEYSCIIHPMDGHQSSHQLHLDGEELRLQDQKYSEQSNICSHQQNYRLLCRK